MAARSSPRRLFGCASLLWLSCAMIPADAPHARQSSATGRFGSLTASSQLNFNITVGKYVWLRVGSADAVIHEVLFAAALAPALGTGNSQAHAGGGVPDLVMEAGEEAPRISATVPVAAFTNVSGTRLSCSVSPLAQMTPLASGATTAGIPGRAEIMVTSGGVDTLQHPGPSLAACNRSTTTPIPMMSELAGTFTYSVTFDPQKLRAGHYGNTITYTAATL